jgi:uncharacterized protein (TIGR03437 family)
MLPYDIPVNRPYQVIVQRGTSATIPETITLAAAGPAVFTKDQSGIGPGLVFDAQFRSNDPTNPAAAGDAIVIYTTGLGDVTPAIPARTDRRRMRPQRSHFFRNAVDIRL